MTQQEKRFLTLFERQRAVRSQLSTTLFDEPCYKGDEVVMCIPHDEIERWVKKDQHGYNWDVTVMGTKRSKAEYYGDGIQLIAVACIHSNSKVLLLELTEGQPHVDHYGPGCLTYLQGHVTWYGNKKPDPIRNAISIPLSHVWEDLMREIEEEITIKNDETLRRSFLKLMKDKVASAKAHCIYLPIPGSPRRHMAIVHDIALDDKTFDQYCDLIESNEPHKHKVVIANWETLLDHDLDQICMWVQASFSVLPFYSSFINGFLNRIRKPAI